MRDENPAGAAELAALGEMVARLQVQVDELTREVRANHAELRRLLGGEPERSYPDDPDDGDWGGGADVPAVPRDHPPNLPGSVALPLPDEHPLEPTG